MKDDGEADRSADGNEEIVLRNMDQTTVRRVVDDLTEVGIRREVIRIEPDRVDGEIDRVTPERDPFACSRCGCYLGAMKRMSGDDYCDGCIEEVLGPYAL